ncbi:hypothetical protein [Conchiformibius steedae]|uniref:hypothetical protein n=1 Tax=Conchiformibius steedae TaxID=153493 RepID=UPI0026F0DE62|nr:hypothetical protein [Conchiformibius steedae]
MADLNPTDAVSSDRTEAAPVPNSETAQAIRAGRADYQAGRLTGYSADTAAQALADMANHD